MVSIRQLDVGDIADLLVFKVIIRKPNVVLVLIKRIEEGVIRGFREAENLVPVLEESESN